MGFQKIKSKSCIIMIVEILIDIVDTERKNKLLKTSFFIRQPVYDQLIIVTVEDLLDQIESSTLLFKLKTSDPVLLQILLLRFLDYDIKEIAHDLHMTPNAVRKRINKFRKKL